MSIFERNRFILLPTNHKTHVIIDPRVSREEQFQQWLDALPPRYCGRHQQTQMELDRTASAENSLSMEPHHIWYERYMDKDEIGFVSDMEIRDKSYPFVACYRCLACRCQYAQVPPEFWQTSISTFEPKTPELAANLAKCLDFIQQINERNCGCLVMAGLNGNGKTRLACNIIRERKVSDSLYCRQAQITGALRSAYGRKDIFLHRPHQLDDEQSPALLETLQQVGFLVVDEIGCTALAKDETQFFDELVKYRYENRKPTILITNLPLTSSPEKLGFKEFIGDAAADRIREATGNGKFILQFSGPSYRSSTGENYLRGLD